MKTHLYSAILADGFRPTLAKEKEITYDADKILNPKEAVDFFKKTFRLDKMAEEHCYMLSRNTQGCITGVFLISKGTIGKSVVGIREVFLMALLSGAASILLCHNHPSGECHPSRDDILLTEKLAEAGKLLGIPLTDHIIIGGSNYYSFKEQEKDEKL